MSDDHTTATRDPFAPVAASPTGRTALAVAASVCAALAAVTGLAPIVGPLGMALGLLAHVKGSRFGMPATILAGGATVVGFAVAFLLR